MRLNHLNLCVGDLSEAKDLFQSLFDFEVEQQKGDAILVMNDRNGFTLVASNPQAFGGEAPAYPEGFHLGFIVDTPEEVDRFCDRLAASRWHDGTLPQPRNIRGGCTLYFTALGGVMFEVTCFERKQGPEK